MKKSSSVSIKSLRKKLTIVFTSIIALILLFMLIITFSMLKRQYNYTQDALIETETQTIIDKILVDRVISDDWLGKQEMNAKSIIYIEDNSVPLVFGGKFIPQSDRNKLINKFKANINAYEIRHRAFITETNWYNITGDFKDVYKGTVNSIHINGNHYLVIYIKDISSQTVYFRIRAFQYALLFIFGTLLFSILIWYLTKITLRSTEQSMEQQKIFIASASHELRSPITVMKTSLSAIEADISTSEQFIPIIHGEIDRIARLAADLTILQTSDLNSWNMKLKALNVDTLCMEMYEAFLPIARKRNQQLILEFVDEKTPDIMGDKQRLQQVIAILLNNAIEYTGENSKIILRVSKVRNKLCIFVIDNGFGISDEEKKNIFKRFYRVDKSRTDKKHNGLGLSIAQEITLLHKGNIILEDTPDGGCTFVLSFPIIK